MDGIRAQFEKAKVPAVVTGFPTAFHVAIGMTEPAKNWSDLQSFDRPRYVQFTTALVKHGVRALERGAWFLSTEHDETIVDQTIEAVGRALKDITA